MKTALARIGMLDAVRELTEKKARRLERASRNAATLDTLFDRDALNSKFHELALAFVASGKPSILKEMQDVHERRLVVTEIRTAIYQAGGQIDQQEDIANAGLARVALEQQIAELMAEKERITAADAARAESSGVDDPSTNLLAVLDRKIVQLKSAKDAINREPGGAINAVTSAATPEPKPRKWVQDFVNGPRDQLSQSELDERRAYPINGVR
jgi:hypothetical protein